MSDSETMYKWRLLFKVPRYSYQYEFHDFVGTNADCDEECDRWTKLGYYIQDAVNYGEYQKPIKSFLEIYMENIEKSDQKFEKE